MMLVEIVIALLVGCFFAIGIAALWIGLLGVAGEVRVARCERCGRLGVAPPSEPLRTCVRCRHEHLLHPVLALHHPGATHHPPGDGPPPA